MGGIRPAMGGLRPAMGGIGPAMGGIRPALGGIRAAMGGISQAMCGIRPATEGRPVGGSKFAKYPAVQDSLLNSYNLMNRIRPGGGPWGTFTNFQQVAPPARRSGESAGRPCGWDKTGHGWDKTGHGWDKTGHGRD